MIFVEGGLERLENKKITKSFEPALNKNHVSRGSFPHRLVIAVSASTTTTTTPSATRTARTTAASAATLAHPPLTVSSPGGVFFPFFPYLFFVLATIITRAIRASSTNTAMTAMTTTTATATATAEAGCQHRLETRHVLSLEL